MFTSPTPMMTRTRTKTAERAAKTAMLAGSIQRAEKRDEEAERITAMRAEKAHANEAQRFQARVHMDEAREIARATGTQVVFLDRRKMDEYRVRYDYREVNSRPTISVNGMPGRIPLVCKGKHGEGFMIGAA